MEGSMKLTTLCLLAAAAAAFAADDPGGWTKAKWGMTDDQILAAFPGQAVRLDPPDAGAHIGIKTFDLADSPFDVRFLSDAAGLRKVVLTALSQPSPRLDALFQDLENLLVDKYGRPWKSDEAGDTDFQWSFPTTTITLGRTKVSGFGTQFVSLIYAKRQPSSSDKL
jgi:hypothetical protein